MISFGMIDLNVTIFITICLDCCYSFSQKACGKMFARKYKLRKHIATVHIVHEGKPFKCKICDKQASKCTKGKKKIQFVLNLWLRKKR